MATKATPQSALHKFQIPSGSSVGKTVAQIVALAHPVAVAQGQDVIQILDPRGGKCVWKLDSNGVATVNPSSFTTTAHVARYSGKSFSDVFGPSNPSLDLWQIVEESGQVAAHCDASGQIFVP